MINACPTLTNALSLFAYGLLLCCISSQSFGEELKILYRNDTELTATLSGAAIDWVTVSQDGTLVERQVELSQIQSLTLALGKSSEILARVRKNISQLGDPDFLVREQAERELVLRGGPFKHLLEQLQDAPSMEVRHRAGRLLEMFSKRIYPPLALDVLVLANGMTLEGEARGFALAGDYRGNPITVDRKRVGQIFRVGASGGESVQTNPVEDDAAIANGANGQSAQVTSVRTKIFHRHTDFATPDQIEFNFETDAEGQPFSDRASVDRVFASQGLLFRNEQTGYVGVSVFSFKYPDLPVGGRSVCLYGEGRSRRQFQGFMEIRFCVPGKPNQSAGVNEVGLFIARVKHSRDIVLEAYNADGNVLATVESSDQQCVFTGVKSNELITRLRIFSNPWLEKLSRKIDLDFAIDTLRMSAPVAVPSVSGMRRRRQHVQLSNGDQFNAWSIYSSAAGQLTVHVRGIADRSVEFTLKQDELASMHLLSPPAQITPKWKAMLEDGSVVGVSPGKTLSSNILDHQFQLDDLVGLWEGTSPARYPIAGDWEPDQALVVFPTCRIQIDPFELGKRSISWTAKKKIEQMLFLGREDPDSKENQEDPTPIATSFDYSNAIADQPPTFWHRQPKTISAGRSFVELTDGQRFMIGQSDPFQFVVIRNKELELMWMETARLNLPLKKIRTIVFPAAGQ